MKIFEISEEIKDELFSVLKTKDYKTSFDLRELFIEHLKKKLNEDEVKDLEFLSLFELCLVCLIDSGVDQSEISDDFRVRFYSGSDFKMIIQDSKDQQIDSHIVNENKEFSEFFSFCEKKFNGKLRIKKDCVVIEGKKKNEILEFKGFFISKSDSTHYFSKVYLHFLQNGDDLSSILPDEALELKYNQEEFETISYLRLFSIDEIKTIFDLIDYVNG